MGYGLIDEKNDEPRMLDCGVLTVSNRIPAPERLYQLYKGLMDILNRCKPEEMAVEEPFVALNIRSALAIGRAQAVAMLAASSKGIPVYTYPPAKIKQAVADYGCSGKEQVQRMVCIQLRLTQIPRSIDATDALAVALCHLQQKHLAKMIAGGDRESS